MNFLGKRNKGMMASLNHNSSSDNFRVGRPSHAASNSNRNKASWKRQRDAKKEGESGTEKRWTRG